MLKAIAAVVMIVIIGFIVCVDCRLLVGKSINYSNFLFVPLSFVLVIYMRAYARVHK